jgi:hypothetical protein
VLGDSTSFETVNKNHLIVERPWFSHYPMFWTLVDGTMRLTPNRLLMRVNANGKFRVGTRCTPHLPQNRAWRINLKANDDCTVRFIFKPYPLQEFTLQSGVSKTVVVTIPNGADPVGAVEINVLSASNLCEVAMADWDPTAPSANVVKRVQYNIVAEISGIATYQSTGLILKPYFVSSDVLDARWDLGFDFDSGRIFF